MGFDKAFLPVEGVANGLRLGRALAAVAAPVVEVGPGASGLPAVRESPAGAGPLVAMCAGATRLRGTGHSGPVLVLACDLPLMTSEVLSTLCGWPGEASVVPLVAGRPQLLCARWSQDDLLAAEVLVQAGERSMKGLLARPGIQFPDAKNFYQGPLSVFADVDTPADLAALGLPAYSVTSLTVDRSGGT